LLGCGASLSISNDGVVLGLISDPALLFRHPRVVVCVYNAEDSVHGLPEIVQDAVELKLRRAIRFVASVYERKLYVPKSCVNLQECKMRANTYMSIAASQKD
jgi:hypothetical protein